MKAGALLSIVLIFCSAILGCGQKGSLVLPEKKATLPVESPAVRTQDII